MHRFLDLNQDTIFYLYKAVKTKKIGRSVDSETIVGLMQRRQGSSVKASGLYNTAFMSTQNGRMRQLQEEETSYEEP